MFQAVKNRDLPTIKKLAEDEPHLVTEVNNKLETPLHWAVKI